MAEEAAEGGLNGKDLSRRGGEEAALEDEGGEEEGAGYMHAFKEARVERGPSCCLTNEGPLLVAKGVELQILKGWGDGHPQVPDYLPLPRRGERGEPWGVPRSVGMGGRICPLRVGCAVVPLSRFCTHLTFPTSTPCFSRAS